MRSTGRKRSLPSRSAPARSKRDDVAALVRSACLNQPQLVVDFPAIDVTVYSGGSSQKIFGVTLRYDLGASVVNDRRTQLDGRVRTLISSLTAGEKETPLQAAFGRHACL